MASHGWRKLGLVTGIFMVIYAFFGGFESIDLFILSLPLPGSITVRFYPWGFFDGFSYVNMFELQWPSCMVTWLTTIFYLAATAMTLSASTPGSLFLNSKRMFALSGLFCAVHLAVYVTLMAFSSIGGQAVRFIGVGFYFILAFGVSNFISVAKVQ